MITVNAAGCGKGKSTHNKQFITAHASSRFLIIVPSLALAAEYTEFGTAIHSGTTNNVKQLSIPVQRDRRFRERDR